MRVSLHHQTLRLRPNLVAAKLSPCNEELLLGGKAIHICRTRLPLERLLICEECDLRSAQITNALPEHQLSVVMNIFLDEVMIELISDACGTQLEIFQVRFGPPVAQTAQKIKLCAFIVEAVRNLVADHHTDRAVIHRVDRIHIKCGRLQNSCWKFD